MIDLKKYEVWFLTGSQHLYGPETLKKVDQDSEIIVRGMSESPHIPVRFVHIPVLTTPEAVMKICLEANNAASCIGVIAWMHTFSPAKMWIGGLKILNRPLLDLHTQFGRDLPWGEIDMDFMNLNQTAHGGREFGHIAARMKKPRKVVVGFWQDENVQKKDRRLDSCCRGLGRQPGDEGRAVRRQHAKRRCHRRGQGGG